MKAQDRYEVRFERDETGTWVAEVKGLDGCITQGRTLESARNRVREAVQAYLDLPVPYDGEIIDNVVLPKATLSAVQKALAARVAADKAAAEASLASRDILHKLREFGLSVADAGTLIGVTRQRAYLILEAATRVRGKDLVNARRSRRAPSARGRARAH